jgi:hypothetical protein
MKVKALRYKKEFNPFQEFVILEDIGVGIEVFTSSTPKLYPESATLEGLKEYIEDNDYFEGLELDWDTVEMVEFDLIEENTISADIRNKLTPSLNLVALLEIFFKDRVGYADEKRAAVAKLIQTEMIKSKENIKYIANLL